MEKATPKKKRTTGPRVGPRGKKKLVTISLTPVAHERLHEMAEKREVSASALLETLIMGLK